MAMSVLAWPGAIAIGLSLGLLGSGGSILTIPVLVYLFGQDEKVAIAGSLFVVGLIALVGGLQYLPGKRIEWRSVLAFGLPGMLGTLTGALLAAHIPGVVQLAMFAVVMLLASVLMLRPLNLQAQDGSAARSAWKVALDGLLVGMVTGLVGVGGGFLIVPALVLLGGLDMHRAVATSLIIIAMNSFSGFYKYLHVLDAQGLALDWKVLGVVSALGIGGSIIGSRMSKRLPQQQLKRGFGVFLIVMGLYILAHSAERLGFFSGAIA